MEQRLPSLKQPLIQQRRRYLTGARRMDVLAFTLILLLMLLADYRLRVYFRAPPVRAVTAGQTALLSG